MSRAPHEPVTKADVRPASIDQAFWLIVGSAVLGAGSYLVRGMQEQPLVVLGVLAVLLCFASFIRSGKNWARFVYTALFLIGLLAFLSPKELMAENGVVFFVVFCLQAILQGYAVWLIFRPPGREWFKRPRTEA